MKENKKKIKELVNCFRKIIEDSFFKAKDRIVILVIGIRNLLLIRSSIGLAPKYHRGKIALIQVKDLSNCLHNHLNQITSCLNPLLSKMILKFHNFYQMASQDAVLYKKLMHFKKIKCLRQLTFKINL